MDLRQLNTFLHTAELGSISKASDRLRIAQPALSRQIRMLEEELKVALFTRHGRGMVLTAAGELLRERAGSVLRQIEDIRADLTAQSGAVRGRVVLGVPPTVGEVLAGRLVERFCDQYPDVAVRIVPAFSGYLLDWLQRGEIDLAVMYAPEKLPNFRVEPLILENLFLIGSSRRGFSVHRAVPFSALVEDRVILPGPQHGLRILVEREANARGLSLTIPIEADALQTLKDLTARNLGVTVLPLASVHAELEAGTLTAASLVEPSLSRKLILAHPLGRQVSNAVRRFAQSLREEVAEMVERGIWNGQLLD
jgi:LysR family nitrogen assimilation transcriptional regulator